MMMEQIKQYLASCPLLADGRINIDYLGIEVGEYSINSEPADPIIKEYVDGGSLRQVVFVLASRQTYGNDIRMQIENSGFFEQFQEWLDEQNRMDKLPELKDATPHAIEALTSGYLFDNDSDQARYQIQCRLVYYKD